MSKWIGGLAAVLCVSTSAAWAQAQVLNDLEPDTAAAYGQRLTDQFKKLKDHQIKFEVDPEQAVGVADGMEGIIVVPVKGLKDGEPDEAVRKEQGAGLAYLFCSQRFNPIIDGKPVDAKKLRTVKYTDDNGVEKDATCLILAVRNIEGDDWRLYAYGADKKPLIDARFRDADKSTEGNLAIAVGEAKDKNRTLVFTLFGKYSADYTIGE